MRWSSDFAYGVGLIVTDECLSNDGRHIDFTSKDIEQIRNLIKIFRLNNKIGLKGSMRKVNGIFKLEFAKLASKHLYKRIYYNDNQIYLKRKYFKINRALSIIQQQEAGMLEW